MGRRRKMSSRKAKRNFKRGNGIKSKNYNMAITRGGYRL